MYNPYANSAFATTSESGGAEVHQRGHSQQHRTTQQQHLKQQTRLYQPPQNQFSPQPAQPQPQYGYNPQQQQQQYGGVGGPDNSGFQFGLTGSQQSPPHHQVPLQPQPQAQYNQYSYGSQGQIPQQQQQNYMRSPQMGGTAPLNNPGQQFGSFFNDPTTMLATQFAKTGFDTSNQYIQQNISLIIGTNGNIKYYFKVSNSYVVRKLLIILFPYYNKTWSRKTNAEVGYVENDNGDPNQAAALAASKVSHLAPPSYDINAPDLYIPLMAFTTYILLWAAFQGLKGDFHPQLFGYLASQTMAFSLLDIGVFAGGLYFLNCFTQGAIWDLVSFSGYKYVVIIVLLAWKHLLGTTWFIYYPIMFGLIGNLAVFLMRSLRVMILPNANSTSNTITANQRRIRIQFLFVYSVIMQGAIILFMSR